MATAGRGTADLVTGGVAPPNRPGPPVAAAGEGPARRLPTLEELLFSSDGGPSFTFHQAVRVLERLAPSRKPIGRAGPPRAEAVRFRAHLSTDFPPSDIFEVQRPTTEVPLPVMVVAFMGLTGPSGALPRHYTEELIRLQRDEKGEWRSALREFFDLFNHRLISLHYRAWEKYRFPMAYERGDFDGREPDPFALAVFSFVGVAPAPLRGRLRVFTPAEEAGELRERPLAKVDDLALLYYSGFLAHRARCAVSLEALLHDYFGLPVRLDQFQGQWLRLAPGDQTCLGKANAALGMDTVAGERVWDVQSKIRLRLGPLSYRDFDAFLPDRTPVVPRKAFFLLCHLVRFYVGPELDYEVQLVLRAPEVPRCQLAAGPPGPRLGWNTWCLSGPARRDAEDAVFAGEEVTIL